MVDDNSCIVNYDMPRKTVVGEERGCFLYRSRNETRIVWGSTKYLSDSGPLRIETSLVVLIFVFIYAVPFVFVCVQYELV